MKALIKVVFVLWLVFTGLLILANLTGIVDLASIEQFLTETKKNSTWLLAIVIIVLLAADLFISVPTLSLCILSGYLLGFPTGMLAATLGVCCTGLIGFLFGGSYGDKVLNLILSNETEKAEINAVFARYGFGMIVFARVAPLLPEVSALLAGMSKMTFRKFATAWLLGSIPFTAIASYSGSISSFENPKPALIALVSVGAGLALLGFLFKRLVKKEKLFSFDPKAREDG